MEHLRIRRAKRRLGHRYVITRDSVSVGEFVAHAIRPNVFRAEGLRLRLITVGLLQPRHVARQAGRGRVVATLYQGPVPGRVRVRFPGEAPVRLRREGVLRPHLVLPDAPGEPAALVLRPLGLTGADARVDLHPSGTWPRERLLVVLALLLQARLRAHAVLA